ncbi:hypothetical protein A7X64_00770 [Stenotrophomonas maltophilia]|nr:hypothetical protein VK66_05605 [Stenotrophomonas maltophilia]PZS62354.1 hypothetical protein A7X64_00770 [Stenotrophomonas maltophilia]
MSARFASSPCTRAMRASSPPLQQHVVDSPRLQLAHVPRMLLRPEGFAHPRAVLVERDIRRTQEQQVIRSQCSLPQCLRRRTRHPAAVAQRHQRRGIAEQPAMRMPCGLVFVLRLCHCDAKQIIWRQLSALLLP